MTDPNQYNPQVPQPAPQYGTPDYGQAQAPQYAAPNYKPGTSVWSGSAVRSGPSIWTGPSVRPGSSRELRAAGTATAVGQ